MRLKRSVIAALIALAAVVTGGLVAATASAGTDPGMTHNTVPGMTHN